VTRNQRHEEGGDCGGGQIGELNGISGPLLLLQSMCSIWYHSGTDFTTDLSDTAPWWMNKCGAIDQGKTLHVLER
jgi:hypothetical protein